MRLSVIAIGKLKAGPEKELAEDYRTRAEAMGRKAGITSFAVTEFAESREATPTARMAEESRHVTATLPPKSYTVVLDERGKSLTSEALAATLQKQIDNGLDLAFVIGGPDGHAPEIRTRANLVVSFGAMTWPHRLVRVMLYEQIYRTITIMTGHPYHRA